MNKVPYRHRLNLEQLRNLSTQGLSLALILLLAACGGGGGEPAVIPAVSGTPVAPTSAPIGRLPCRPRRLRKFLPSWQDVDVPKTFVKLTRCSRRCSAARHRRLRRAAADRHCPAIPLSRGGHAR